jgi:beta-phosphoglucomutase-like phosphatase (HAD superfamily)
MNNKIKNIIFDMNGTMIFDGKYHEIAWKDYGVVVGIIPTPIYHSKIEHVRPFEHALFLSHISIIWNQFMAQPCLFKQFS